jgi:Domain of unknown function (DUF4260)
MKNLIRLEEAAMFGLTIYLFSLLSIDWWWYPVLILAPDLSAIGYLVNTKLGAFTYNLVHHKAVAIIVYVAGLSMGNEVVQLAGLILFGHSSMDRLFGYGLKYPDSFKHTHLGMIGKATA